MLNSFYPSMAKSREDAAAVKRERNGQVYIWRTRVKVFIHFCLAQANSQNTSMKKRHLINAHKKPREMVDSREKKK